MDQPSLAPWANVGLEQVDAEVAYIFELEKKARPLPPVAQGIRELITRLEICHFKIERHLDRILSAIGSLRLDLEPAAIGKAHPRAGEFAWKQDATGRSRQGQEIIWVLQLWMEDDPPSNDDDRPVPAALVAEVNHALGAPDPRKNLLVSALINRLRLKPDRQPLPPELAGFWVPIERMDICHYAFPGNVKRTIGSIGRLEPLADCEGCGSFDEARRRLAEDCFRSLCAWLRGEASQLGPTLGEQTPLKVWLAACLAKTLKELVGLRDTMPAGT